MNYLLTDREGKDGGGKGPLISEELSLTLARANNQVLFKDQYGMTEKMTNKDHIQDYGIQPLRVATVCSGIGAPEEGMKDLPFEFVWSSEIEPFPCRVLKHHYPDVPNLGDMTKLFTNETFINEPIELLVGGTPCQSFSIAGLRGGLDDERGNLALVYCRILMVKQPKWFIWENVPGVLSSSDGADFAAILSGFTGKDIKPQRFAEAGIIQGELYSISWRVLDSQYFGVPQRRRRVFVVGHLGDDWRPSAAVLFERESLRRDITPRREARKEATGALRAGTEVSGGDAIACETADSLTIGANQTTGFCGDVGATLGNEATKVGQWWDNGDTAHTLTKSSHNQYMPDKDNFQAVITDEPKFFSIQRIGESKESANTHTLSRRDYKDATDLVTTPYTQSIDCRNDAVNDEISGTLQTKSNGGQSLNYINPIYTIQTAQTGANGSNISEDVSESNSPEIEGVKVVEFDLIRKESFCINTGQVNANGSNVIKDKSFTLSKNDKYAVCYGFDSLSSNSMKSSNPHSGVHVDDIVKTLDSNVPCPSKNQGGNLILTHIARRLTPKETLRLQGFPDDYLDIQGASDSAKYAAIGNSMTTYVLQWLGHRIALFEKVSKKIA